MQLKKLAALSLFAVAAACSVKSPTEPQQPKEDTPTESQDPGFKETVFAEFSATSCTSDGLGLDITYVVLPSTNDAKRLNKPLPFNTADSAIVQAQSVALTKHLASETKGSDYKEEGPTEAFFTSLGKWMPAFDSTVKAQTGGLRVQIAGGGYNIPSEACTPGSNLVAGNTSAALATARSSVKFRR